MPPPIALSKSKLLSFLQCPRKLWLEQYSPELEDENAVDLAAIETGRIVGEMARRVYSEKSGGHRISNERGLRAAVSETAERMAAGGGETLFEATFGYDGLTVQVDVLDRSTAAARLIEVKSTTCVKDHHVYDCAIQAWTLEQCGHSLSQVALAHINNEFVYSGDENFQDLFAEADLTEPVAGLTPGIPELIERTRATLAELDEPKNAIGGHCRSPYICPFFEHCAPAQGRYPVTGLGGRKQALYDLMLEGFTDIREVPADRLKNVQQRRILQQTADDTAFVGRELGEFVSALAYPRYYLDFETMAFAIPIWPDTRPYEALPFQWSCHLQNSPNEIDHREFLDLSGQPPMRTCTEALIQTLGTEGPILVYSSYEQRIITEMAERFPDLTEALAAIRERLVDLLPIMKAHYYHPDMLGSWSIKAVLPTIAPELDYSKLTDVQNGEAAQTAYLEAIHATTAPDRHAALHASLSEYCRYDTLALVKLVAFFSKP